MTHRFQPAASLITLQRRAGLLRTVREFFHRRGFWECETPVLSAEFIPDAHLEPFLTTDPAGRRLFLQTSPEAGMKRLLAAGADSIFQIARVMRRGESGERHNPEFTLLEWYQAGTTHLDQMNLVEQLVRTVYSQAAGWTGAANVDPGVAGRPAPVTSQTGRLLELPFERLTYDEAFERHAGARVLTLSTRQLADLARARGVSVPLGLSTDAVDRDAWLNLLLAELVEPCLGQAQPQFLTDFPASQAALARVNSGPPAVAERFELYDRGIELCNGYHELTDPDELAARLEAGRTTRGDLPADLLPGAPLLEAALRHGLPPCSGVALGLDRLVMLALGLSRLDEVLAFPHDRA